MESRRSFRERSALLDGRLPPPARNRTANAGIKRCADAERWYWPHHSMLEQLVNDVIVRSGVCLIVDCHSFPSVALPYELDQTSQRADICIGTDAFHTPSAISDALVAAAERERYSVAVDAPFAGALVPLSSYQNDHRVLSVIDRGQ